MVVPDHVSGLVSATAGRVVAVVFAVSANSAAAVLSEVSQETASVVVVDLSTAEGEEAALDMGVTSPPEVRAFLDGELKLTLRTAE